jgi:peptide/nickel transport system substrate-binding protein
LSYFTEAELGNNNDANWVDPAYEALYAEQKVELDPARRVEIVHEMLTIMHDAAVYIPMYLGPDLQAYRTDTFEGWVQQPAGVGPVMFSNSSPSYPLLRPVGSEPDGGATDSTVAGDTTAPGDGGTTVAGTDDGDGDVGAGPEPGDDDGGINLLLIGGIAAVVVLGGAFLIQRRRSTADERE